MEHPESHAVQHERVPASCAHPRFGQFIELGQESGVERIGALQRGIDHLAGRNPVEDRRKSSEVVGVRVGEHHRLQPPHPVATEERHHHAAARVGGGPRRARRPRGSSAQPGVRMAAASPCPTSRKCNASSDPSSGRIRRAGRLVPRIQPQTATRRPPSPAGGRPRHESSGAGSRLRRRAARPTGIADASRAGTTRCPPGTTAPHRAISCSTPSPRPAPAASGAASDTDTAPMARLAMTAGTTTAARGIATRLSPIPMSATEPSAAAVIGAVARVAPTDVARVLVTPPLPSRRDDHSARRSPPPRAPRSKATRRGRGRPRDRRAGPRARSCRGGRRRGASAVGCARWPGCTMSAAARAAGAGQPRKTV